MTMHEQPNNRMPPVANHWNGNCVRGYTNVMAVSSILLDSPQRRLDDHKYHAVRMVVPAAQGVDLK